MTLNQIKALIKESEETGWPIQFWNIKTGHWESVLSDHVIQNGWHYRVAPPKPPKPREWWLRPAPNRAQSEAWDSHPGDNHEQCKATGLVLVREVLEDSK